MFETIISNATHALFFRNSVTECSVSFQLYYNFCTGGGGDRHTKKRMDCGFIYKVALLPLNASSMTRHKRESISSSLEDGNRLESKNVRFLLLA